MDEESCWQAVLARDVRADGEFVFAVRSTGIYCRPSCPARRPRRDQVVFFPQPEAAEQEGFRACLRCRPREGGPDGQQVELIERVCRYIQSHREGALSLAVLGAQVGVSPHHLQRTFKRIMGITPRQYAEACRLESLKERLREGEGVTRALYEAGYGSSSRLYERAPLQMGMTPTVYRRGGRGMRVSYTVVDCPLGRLLVAATERGLCAISLGEADEVLEDGLKKEYPLAEIHRDESRLNPWTGVLLSHLDGRHPHLDLPLDVQATAFQWRVWETLRAIPYGSTWSYGEIARSLERPRAARAVARACAANPVALAIPCHRAVREDGDLGGYRWGLERKRRLLAQEQTSSGCLTAESVDAMLGES